MLLSDMGVKNCEEMKMKLMMMAMKVKKEMKKCPIAKKLMKQIKKMVMLVETTKVQFDMPAEKDVMDWVKKNDFKPWM